jgi:hypothetical protein
MGFDRLRPFAAAALARTHITFLIAYPKNRHFDTRSALLSMRFFALCTQRVPGAEGVSKSASQEVIQIGSKSRESLRSAIALRRPFLFSLLKLSLY